MLLAARDYPDREITAVVVRRLVRAPAGAVRVLSAARAAPETVALVVPVWLRQLLGLA
jgi:hypothetical protein